MGNAPARRAAQGHVSEQMRPTLQSVDRDSRLIESLRSATQKPVFARWRCPPARSAEWVRPVAVVSGCVGPGECRSPRPGKGAAAAGACEKG